MPYRELLLGCGYRRTRLIDPYLYTPQPPPEFERWQNLTTVDINPECKPDFCLDLNRLGMGFVALPQDETNLTLIERNGRVNWRFRSNMFQEIHAYEVLEHLGALGDAASFFRDFSELWRILTPGGFLCATVPSRYSTWLWGDPGHTRAILPASLGFLCRPHYDRYVGSSPSSDYRPLYAGDFDILRTHDDDYTHTFVLKAVKPIRDPVPMAVRA